MIEFNIGMKKKYMPQLPVALVVTPDDIELLVSTVTVAWLLLATVAAADDDDIDDDAVDDPDVFGVVLTAKILPWFVRM